MITDNDMRRLAIGLYVYMVSILDDEITIDGKRVKLKELDTETAKKIREPLMATALKGLLGDLNIKEILKMMMGGF